MKKFYVYIVECIDGSLYTGWTLNIQSRINKHNSGKGAKYTKTRRPVKLIYFEEFSTKNLAMKREIQIKSMNRNQKFSLINMI